MTKPTSNSAFPWFVFAIHVIKYGGMQRSWKFRVATVSLLISVVCASTSTFGEPATPSVIVPNPGVWETINHLDPQLPVEIGVASGVKWRIETGNKEKVMIAVFDGKSLNASFPIENKDAVDPGMVLRSIQRDAAHPTNVETIEKNGKKYIAFHCRDVDSDITLYVDFATRIPVKMVGHAKKGQPVDVEFKFIPFDVKAHEAELFDTTKLKSFFSEYLPPGKPPAPSGTATPH